VRQGGGDLGSVRMKGSSSSGSIGRPLPTARDSPYWLQDTRKPSRAAVASDICS
jgi:hypothetical protein